MSKSMQLSVLLASFISIIGCGIKRNKEYISTHSIKEKVSFPKNFLWGTATASEQIESTPDSDWFQFEKEVLKNKKFETLGPGEAKPGHIHNLGNYTYDQVLKRTNHETMFEEDFRMAKEMKHNSYRFSIAWDKLFPEESMTSPDAKAVSYYKSLIASMKKNNLRPSATLFHFSTPAWFWNVKNGKRGWEREDALQKFELFVKAVVKNFGADVTHWCTLNEPMVYIFSGYMQGVFPPNETRADVNDLALVLSNLLKAHALSYRIIKENDLVTGLKSEVGFTMHTRAFEAYRNYAPLDSIVAGKVEQAFIWDFVDAAKTGILKITNTDYSEEIPGLKNSLDYLGINYYGRFYIKTNIFSPTKFQTLPSDPDDKNERRNNLNWAHYPLGFNYILTKSYEKYKLPIYVLENGTADSADDDQLRQEILVTHLYEMWNAMQNGKVDIRGYFHWSLIDNFEWAEGYEAKFGLAKTDYNNNYRRIPRPSAKIYSEMIENGISPELFKRYAALYK